MPRGCVKFFLTTIANWNQTCIQHVDPPLFCFLVCGDQAQARQHAESISVHKGLKIQDHLLPSWSHCIALLTTALLTMSTCQFHCQSFLFDLAKQLRREREREVMLLKQTFPPRKGALCVERPPLQIVEPDYKQKWRAFKEARATAGGGRATVLIRRSELTISIHNFGITWYCKILFTYFYLHLFTVLDMTNRIVERPFPCQSGRSGLGFADRQSFNFGRWNWASAASFSLVGFHCRDVCPTITSFCCQGVHAIPLPFFSGLCAVGIDFVDRARSKRLFVLTWKNVWPKSWIRMICMWGLWTVECHHSPRNRCAEYPQSSDDTVMSEMSSVSLWFSRKKFLLVRNCWMRCPQVKFYNSPFKCSKSDQVCL